MDIGVASIISSTIIGAAGIAVSLIYGYIPAKRRVNEKQLYKELLRMYENASSLLAIEKELTDRLGLTKRTVRKNYTLSKDIEPTRLAHRIAAVQTLTKE